MAVNRIPTDHAAHDELRIAAYAAGDLEGAELAIATESIASCPACARLADDLALIRSATSRLPQPGRTRDFRLTEADAARLRPPGWRRFVASLAGPRFALTQPLAAGLATLGLAGILLATVPAGLGGFGASMESSTVGGALQTSGDRVAAPEAPPSDGAGAAGQAPSVATPEPAPSSGAAALAPSGPPPSEPPVASGDAGGGAAAPGSGEPAESQKDLAFGTSAEGAAVTGPPPLMVVSLVLLVVGLGLLAVRLAARRLFAG
jgi:anti-sigma factor RsiW